MSIAELLAILIGGGIGAVGRFVVDGILREDRTYIVPWPTVFINISGSLLLGFVATAATLTSASPMVAAAVGTGMLGGYTTFSTASVETARLLQRAAMSESKDPAQRFDPTLFKAALTNLTVTLVGSVIGAFVGISIAVMIFH